MNWPALTTSFEEHTVAWLLLSTILGGVAGSTITLLFDEVLRPRLAMRRETRRVYRRYRNPLLGSANSLERQINTIVRNRGEAWLTDEYYQLSTFYKFGSFLFWVRKIELEVGFLDMTSSARAKEFSRCLYGPFSGLSSVRRYFGNEPDATRTALLRDIARAIGEEMAAPSDAAHTKAEPIGFADFVRRYGTDPQFRGWFRALEAMLQEMADKPGRTRLERLIVTGAQLKRLIAFLDPQEVHASRDVSNLDLIERPELRDRLGRDLGPAG